MAQSSMDLLCNHNPRLKVNVWQHQSFDQTCTPASEESLHTDVSDWNFVVLGWCSEDLLIPDPPDKKGSAIGSTERAGTPHEMQSHSSELQEYLIGICRDDEEHKHWALVAGFDAAQSAAIVQVNDAMTTLNIRWLPLYSKTFLNTLSQHTYACYLAGTDALDRMDSNLEKIPGFPTQIQRLRHVRLPSVTPPEDVRLLTLVIQDVIRLSCKLQVYFSSINRLQGEPFDHEGSTTKQDRLTVFDMPDKYETIVAMVRKALSSRGWINEFIEGINAQTLF